MFSIKWIVVVAVAALLGLALFAPLGVAHDEDDDKVKGEFEMAPGPFAPGAEGEIEFKLKDGVLSGEFEADDLPDLGHHAFYVLWFVVPGADPSLDNKVFLGPISDDDSILSLTEGKLSFSAAHFTTGPSVGLGIELGATNVFVLIAEVGINTMTPVPISAPPTSFALIVIFAP